MPLSAAKRQYFEERNESCGANLLYVKRGSTPRLFFRRREMGHDLTRLDRVEPVRLGRRPAFPVREPRLIDPD